MGNILWLASYPKSGNTWVRAFLHNLLADPDEPVDINKMAALTQGDSQRQWYDAAAGRETLNLAGSALAALRPAAHGRIAGSGPDTVFVKTHNALIPIDGVSMVTREVTAGAIYIVRNPLDVVVSYAHHLGQPLDAMITLMETKDFSTPASKTHVPEHQSDWSTHVESWTAVAHPALHVVRYEDLSAAPIKTFGALARFLGAEASPERLRRAVRFSSFRVLRAQEAEHGFIERTPAQDRFFRAGKVGGWKKHLNPSQVSRIVAGHGKQMARFGYVPKGY